ncbi:phosphate metabolism protein 7 [Basidiobolus ranarum]|uniref:Phosphate metabolism protein 7 n=1 Tax=Basidiobolus ranarum TaxID=34480 RepID=A0ABR2WZ50_9FUNG
MEATDATNNDSVASFVSSLLFNLGIAGGLYVAYIVVRHLDDSIYEPRTFMIEEEKRPPKLGKSPISWIIDVYKTPDKVLLKRIGLDAYVFLRFVRMCLFIFSIMSAISLVILLPVNTMNKDRSKGLNYFSISNITKPSSFWAHVILDYTFTGLVLYFMYRETSEYIKLRQQYLLSPEHQSNPISSTILITGIPDRLNDPEKLKKVFSLYPGGIQHIYINKNASKLHKDVKKRKNVLEKLELAESNFIMASLKDPTKTPKRPTHRQSWIPFRGPKIDSIDYYKQELARLNAQILEQQKDPSKFPRKASAFITFRSQISAHLAVQSLAHNKPLVMEGRYLEVNPKEVIWENLNMFSLERYIRKTVAIGLGAGLIVLWFIPATFVTALFNIQKLAVLIPPLKGMENWNSAIIGIIQGVLPSLGMSILMNLLPHILALLSRYEGLVRDSDIQISVMTKYFFFLIVNVLLVTTFVGGVFNVLHELTNNPGAVIDLLATSLPTASTFFITYVVLNGLSGGAKELLQAVPFLLRFVTTSLLPKTPRRLTRLKAMPCIQWGTFFPQHTLVFVIGIVYSTIAPLLLIFVTTYFLIFYFVYHHQFQYVYDFSKFQSGGLLFPKAIYHMFVGLYIYHLTMAGLVSAKGAYAQLIMQIILLVLTFAANLYGLRGFGPLIKFLPINIVEDPTLIGLMENQACEEGYAETISSMGTESNSSMIQMHKLDKHLESEKNDYHIQYNNGDNTTPRNSTCSTLNCSRRKSKHNTALPPVYNQGPDSAFLHPALREPVPVVWLPKDTLGIADREIYALEKAGQPATTEGSAINNVSGNISVSMWTAPSLLYRQYSHVN